MSAINPFLQLPGVVHWKIQSHQTIREHARMKSVCKFFAFPTSTTKMNHPVQRISLATSLIFTLDSHDWEILSYQKMSTVLTNRSFRGVRTLHLAIPPRDGGSQSLIPLIRSGFPTLQSLKLFENNEYPCSQQDLHALLAPQQGDSPFPNNLTSLSLISRVTLFSEKIGPIINGITSLTSIEVFLLGRLNNQNLQEIGQIFSQISLTNLRFCASDEPFLSHQNPIIDSASYAHLVQIQSIESLTITGSHLELEGVKSLADLPSLRSLTWGQHGDALDVVKATSIWAKGARKLEEFRCMHLKANCDQVLAECVKMIALTRIYVLDTTVQISNKSFISLSKCERLTEIDLQVLSLSSHVDTTAFMFLSKNRFLKSLILSREGLSHFRLEKLISAVNSISSLRSLTLRNRTTTDRVEIKASLREGIDFFTK